MSEVKKQSHNMGPYLNTTKSNNLNEVKLQYDNTFIKTYMKLFLYSVPLRYSHGPHLLIK